ncbi:ATP-binding protein [Streptomyces sp. NPDC008150]|uniref:ATP-binding protein n=1 Tax=Streptomyces sp. NPDC008150 TaxID=3364816 RepID=UPI0036F10666
MEPIKPGPEEFGPAGDDSPPRQRPPRDPLTPDFGQHLPVPLARTARLATGEYLLTVNPVDGSEVEIRPPAERGERPRRLTAEQRAASERAGRLPVPSGPAQPAPPLLHRQDEREELVRMIARGRSVRLTGPSGSGRTSLLDVVADDCSDLAPDGVVRLCGLHRTANDLLYDLFYAVHDAAGFRPEGDELLELVREIGAVVVVDDLEFGESALDELLDATPECAFLLAATPDVPAPTADSGIEEVAIGGLDRAGGLELLERAAGRSLTDEERNWAGDLWFESEGLPLRFVQAGALLRRRDQQQAEAEAFDDAGVFDGTQADVPVEVADSPDAPPPSLAEGAAAARLLAAGLGDSARFTLRLAVALGGEVPHQAHLPALIGDTHADAALGELLDSALISPAGVRYRLAAGVRTQLEAAGYADDIEATALTAARHYAWWAGHPSVTPERVCAEADAVLAALAVLVPVTTPPREGEESVTVRLARAAAPAFAAGGHWSAWERALRSGTEASRLAGEVADQAYFHHELGVLALCVGLLDRARAELEASIGLRGAVADKRGSVAGRRALALVDDRSGTRSALLATVGEEVPEARSEESAPPSGAALVPFPQLRLPDDEPATVISHRLPAGAAVPKQRGGLRSLAKRNMVAAGAGALLVAVLGTVVTLGATSHEDADSPSRKAGANPSATQGTGSDSLGADRANSDSGGDTGSATSRPTDPGPDGTLGTSDDPTPPAEEPSASATGTKAGGTSSKPSASTTPGKTSKPTKSTKPTKPTTPPPTDETSEPTGGDSSEPPTDDPTPDPSDTESTEPSTTDSASGPVATNSAEESGSSATSAATQTAPAGGVI